MKIKRFMILFVFVGLLLPVFSMPTVASQTDTSLQDIIDRGSIIVGCEAGYPPFEMLDPETDEFIGFDPEIMQIIADEIGVTIDWRNVAWATIFTSLAAGNFDCVISAVTITAEREETMDFSRWYFKSSQAVLVTNDNPKAFATIADVNVSTVKVGVQEGTTSDLYLQDNNFTTEVVSFATVTLAIAALNGGTVDVVLGDHATLLAGAADTLKVVDTFSPEDFGIPVVTGSDSLRLKINEVLDGLLGTDLKNPAPTKEYNDIYNTWMDVNAVGYVAPGIPGFSVILLIAVVSSVTIPLIRKEKK
ncbi:MAG: Loki-CTERM sorting domain-containing protein [Promethearchaeota archaeon]